MTKPELAQLLLALGGSYQRQIGDDQLAVWWEVIGSHETDAAMRALRWFCTNEETMPTPARFRSRVLAEERSAREQVPALPEQSEGPELTPEENLAWVRRAREQLSGAA